jgi:hypothetical protein
MPADVPRMIGFIGAAAVAGLLTTSMGIGGILRLIIIVLVGVGGGLVGEYVAKQSRKP